MSARTNSLSFRLAAQDTSLRTLTAASNVYTAMELYAAALEGDPEARSLFPPVLSPYSQRLAQVSSRLDLDIPGLVDLPASMRRRLAAGMNLGRYVSDLRRRARVVLPGLVPSGVSLDEDEDGVKVQMQLRPLGVPVTLSGHFSEGADHDFAATVASATFFRTSCTLNWSSRRLDASRLAAS